MANLQQTLQKATFATVMATDKLLGMKNDPESSSLQFNELITNDIDVVALLGHAAHELSHLRREKLKPALKPAYHALCSSETITASTKYLFGDNLAKQIRDAKETNRIGNAVGSSKHDYRPIHRDSSWPNRRHNAYKSGSANRQPFLGKGLHATVRKKYDNSQKKGQKKITQLITQLKNSVSDFPLFIETTLRPYLQSRCDTFQAGNISHSLDVWKEMTSDKDILSTVMGMSIEFSDKPIQHYLPTGGPHKRRVCLFV